MTVNAFVIDGEKHDTTKKVICNHCSSHDAPFVRFTHYGRETNEFYSCIPCLGKAIQMATGWKVLNTFSQWRLQQITGEKTRAYRQAVLDAKLRGEPLPPEPEGVWKPGKRSW